MLELSHPDERQLQKAGAMCGRCWLEFELLTKFRSFRKIIKIASRHYLDSGEYPARF
jgi:hypothetical protein